jgi:hypothetical protein
MRHHTEPASREVTLPYRVSDPNTLAPVLVSVLPSCSSPLPAELQGLRALGPRLVQMTSQGSSLGLTLSSRVRPEVERPFDTRHRRVQERLLP